MPGDTKIDDGHPIGFEHRNRACRFGKHGLSVDDSFGQRANLAGCEHSAVGHDENPHLTRAVALCFVASTAVMLRYDSTMRAAGGPGIIGFELAGTESRASAILDRWGASGTVAARTSLLLDFGYMTNYGLLAVLLSRQAQRRRPRPILDAAMTPFCLVAVAADAVEGASLLRILGGALNRHRLARRARRCALLKFAALAVVLSRCAEAQLTHGHRLA